MTTCDRVTEPCGVERFLIGWYRQELHDVTSGNRGRPASRVQRRIAWRNVRHRVAEWIVFDVATGNTLDQKDVRVWQRIGAHLCRAT